jgi:SAM-dependent methyltransferase
MLYRRRVIPRRLEELWALTPRLAAALARKESCDCAHCGAKLRGRRLAQVLLSLYSSGWRPGDTEPHSPSSVGGAFPLTPDPSPRRGEGNQQDASLSPEPPLTPDPSLRRGEGNQQDAGLAPEALLTPNASHRRGEGNQQDAGLAPEPPSPLAPLPVGARGTGDGNPRRNDAGAHVHPPRPPGESPGAPGEGRVRGDCHNAADTEASSASRAGSLSRWVELPEIQALRVAEINRIDGLHEQLARLPRFASSDYVPGAIPGATVDGVRSEDLTRLTYPDDSFDLVLTSETLEHVPDLSAALGEIRRVLAPGGLHVFTIPLLPHVPRTFARAVALADGTVRHDWPRICHPGGDVGYPVITEFGADLPLIFDRAGFSLDVYLGPTRDDDLTQVYVCRKR